MFTYHLLLILKIEFKKNNLIQFFFFLVFLNKDKTVKSEKKIAFKFSISLLRS